MVFDLLAYYALANGIGGLRSCKHGVELSRGLGLCDADLGQAAQDEPVVCRLGHASEAKKEQPMTGMPTMENACDGVDKPAGVEQAIHNTQLTGECGDLGVVEKCLGCVSAELDHAADAGTAGVEVQPTTEGAL